MRTKHKHIPFQTYGLWDELLASETKPTPLQKRQYQLTRMWQGLVAIETDAAPTTEDWRVCSDAVNLLETLVSMNVIADGSGLLDDAVQALAVAGKRHFTHSVIRLDAAGIQALRAVLEDYEAVLEAVPHRTIVRCHRITERRIQDILAGKRKAPGVEVIAI